ncbi:flagellar export protein FliJ [Variovorax sp. YR216]|uniref:flagellar export protein FliJ n=1 Tax=Variovorax sp. YR216 TaxID=1882828 RepID=UPI0008949406|nr:flagellar export protein FliJ [Variovorax sp. YR216]SEA42249.1 flagellar FliJ protein [Variovorax sp. YR216]
MPQRLPLEMLTDLARTQTDESAKRLGLLQNAQLSASQKLEMLMKYRQDYVEQLQALMSEGLATAKLRNYQAFLATLDGAIEQQRAIVAQALTRLDHGRDDWRNNKRRLNSFDTLAERVRRQELMAQAKREQRESDERAARKFFDRAANPTI